MEDVILTALGSTTASVEAIGSSVLPWVLGAFGALVGLGLAIRLITKLVAKKK